MNIGFVSSWFERGASMVTKAYMDLVSKDHQCFVYRRYEKWGYEQAAAEWKQQYVTSDPSDNEITWENFEKWIKENKISVLFWNEQRTIEEVKKTKALGILNIAYVDYYVKPEDAAMGITPDEFSVYDYIFCNTERHYSVFKHLKQALHIPWGTDIDLFKPKVRSEDRNTLVFFHNAGWGGAQYRKGTNFAVEAFQLIKDTNVKLVIHTQLPLKNYSQEMQDIISKDKRIEVIEGSIPAPGIYHYGDVFVYPTKLEGIGLSAPEALACGLPIIVPDNGPMNEFIKEGNGRVVKIDKFYQREGLPYYWDVCEVNVADLAKQMKEYIFDFANIKDHKKKARETAEKYFDWKKNGQPFVDIITQIAEKKESKKVKTIREKFLGKKTPLKIAHFSYFAPNQSGMYETTRDIIQLEQEMGINAGLINTLSDSRRTPYQVYADHALITRPLEWAIDADLLVLHSSIPAEMDNFKIPRMFVAHGQPYHCYMDECYVEKFRDFKFESNISGEVRIDDVYKHNVEAGKAYKFLTRHAPTYTQMINYMKDTRIKATVTLWKEHKQYLDAVGNYHTVHFVPAMTDLNFFNPEGEKYEKYSDKNFNIAFCDMWRTSKDPFAIMHAFRQFKEKVPNAKLHLYGYLKDVHGHFWDTFFRHYDCLDSIGEIVPIVTDIEKVYRAADMIVTTRSFETRIVRESMASGTPLVACGFPGIPYDGGNYENPDSIFAAMMKCYDDINKKGRDYVGKKMRKYAEKNFSYKNSADHLLKVFEEIFRFHKPIPNITQVIADQTKPKIHLVGPYKANPWGAENRMIAAIRKEQYPLTLTDYRVEKDYEDKIRESDADLMIVFKGEKLTHQLLNNVKCKKVLWYPDDVLELQRAADDVSRQASGYDIVYSFQKGALDKYKELGCKVAKYLPFSVGADIYRKVKCEKFYDVVFIGSMYENRFELIKYLREKGIRVFVPTNSITNYDLVEMYNRSKIILNLAIGKSGLNNRVFEALGSGSLLITNEPDDDIELFRDKEHLVFYKDKEDCLEKIKYYLENEKEREEIALNGYTEVIHHHTYKERLEKMLRDTGLLK